MTAVRYGIAAYNGRALTPRLEWGYDTYEARLSRYAIMDAYRNGTAYSSNEAFSESLKIANRLYRHIRDTHSPVKIATDLIAANVYQGAVDLQNLKGGALPFQYDNPNLEEPLRLLLKWSNLGQQLDGYVREAAVKGDTAWWVVDDPVRRRVRLERIDAAWIREKVTDEAGNIKAAVIEYEREEDPDISGYRPKQYAAGRARDTYLYTMTMARTDDGVLFQTFKNGEPFAYHVDETGMEVAAWTAPYPVVPLKVAHYEPGPGEWGKSAFFASLSKINEINDAQSLYNDTVRRVIEPILKARNITAEAAVTAERNERTGITVLYIQGEDADIEPIVIPVDLAAAGANIDRLEATLERDLPVLALQRMRDKGERITAPGVQAGYSDAIGMIEMARRNLDPGIVQALQIGITIGAVRNYEGFSAFDAMSYDNGDMELTLAERPVVADKLTRQERMQVYQSLKDQPPAIQRLMLQEMAISNDVIDTILADTAQMNAPQLPPDIERILSGLDGNGDTEPADGAPERPATPVPARVDAAGRG